MRFRGWCVFTWCVRKAVSTLPFLLGQPSQPGCLELGWAVVFARGLRGMGATSVGGGRGTRASPHGPWSPLTLSPLQPQDTRGSPGRAQQLQGWGGGVGYLGRQHGWTLPLTGAPSCSRPIGVGVFTGSNDKLGFLWALAIYLLWGGFPLARLLCDQRNMF